MKIIKIIEIIEIIKIIKINKISGPPITGETFPCRDYTSYEV